MANTKYAALISIVLIVCLTASALPINASPMESKLETAWITQETMVKEIPYEKLYIYDSANKDVKLDIKEADLVKQISEIKEIDETPIKMTLTTPSVALELDDGSKYFSGKMILGLTPNVIQKITLVNGTGNDYDSTIHIPNANFNEIYFSTWPGAASNVGHYLIDVSAGYEAAESIDVLVFPQTNTASIWWNAADAVAQFWPVPSFAMYSAADKVVYAYDMSSIGHSGDLVDRVTNTEDATTLSQEGWPAIPDQPAPYDYNGTTYTVNASGGANFTTVISCYQNMSEGDIMDVQDAQVMATAFTISKSIKIMSTTGGSIDMDIVGVQMVTINPGYKVSFDNIAINPDNNARRGIEVYGTLFMDNVTCKTYDRMFYTFGGSLIANNCIFSQSYDSSAGASIRINSWLTNVTINLPQTMTMTDSQCVIDGLDGNVRNLGVFSTAPIYLIGAYETTRSNPTANCTIYNYGDYLPGDFTNFGMTNNFIFIGDTAQTDAVTGDGTTIKAAYNQNVTIARNDSAHVYAFVDGELKTLNNADYVQYDTDGNLILSATGGDVYYFTIGLSEALTADEYLALDSDLALGYEYGGQTVESLILPLLFIAVVIALFAVTLGLLSTGFKRSQ